SGRAISRWIQKSCSTWSSMKASRFLKVGSSFSLVFLPSWTTSLLSIMRSSSAGNTACRGMLRYCCGKVCWATSSSDNRMGWPLTVATTGSLSGWGACCGCAAGAGFAAGFWAGGAAGRGARLLGGGGAARDATPPHPGARQDGQAQNALAKVHAGLRDFSLERLCGHGGSIRLHRPRRAKQASAPQRGRYWRPIAALFREYGVERAARGASPVDTARLAL